MPSRAHAAEKAAGEMLEMPLSTLPCANMTYTTGSSARRVMAMMAGAYLVVGRLPTPRPLAIMRRAASPIESSSISPLAGLPGSVTRAGHAAQRLCYDIVPQDGDAYLRYALRLF